jgi:hypothetical protein
MPAFKALALFIEPLIVRVWRQPSLADACSSWESCQAETPDSTLALKHQCKQ